MLPDLPNLVAGGAGLSAVALLLALLKLWLNEIQNHRVERAQFQRERNLLLKEFGEERKQIIDSYQHERSEMILRHAADIQQIQVDHAERIAILRRRLYDALNSRESDQNQLDRRWYDNPIMIEEPPKSLDEGRDDQR